ncbi:MAG TPA: TIGR03086 family metal-binding protein [Actinomycetes bacterium]|nr:TIGR03086 family metal-binding protein [Actinomycetes bacterium]
MTDTIEAFRRATGTFGRHVHAVRDDQWDLPTPCSDWDVRALVNHLVGEQVWIPPLVGGATVAEVGDRFDGDLLGGDPRAAWDAAALEAVAAFERPGAMEATVHLSYADVLGEHYAFEVMSDLLVHGWDLATAIGADRRLDPDLVEAVYGHWLPRAGDMAASGAFGTRLDPPPGADRQTELLALFGRRA